MMSIPISYNTCTDTCTCVYTFLYIYIHTYTYTYTYTHAHIYIHIHTYIHTYTHTPHTDTYRQLEVRKYKMFWAKLAGIPGGLVWYGCQDEVDRLRKALEEARR